MIGGYRLLREEPLKHLKGTYYQLIHTPTGARHIHVACPDDNKAFSVTFPTVPTDSTGVAHILEHAALAGSKRFPVKDAFFSMRSRSLATFMNAFTSSDATSYPFSTRNTKDFYNLLAVYLDAVFFPRLAETSFSQEGHRLEFEKLDDQASGLRFKGVVYNEMKGAMASPGGVMFRTVGKALFPDLTYANNSGGDPRDIPDLTWEALKQFHARHYHPSNSYFFTYGDMPAEEVLRVIEDQALSAFSKIDIDTSIPLQRPFPEPIEVRETYPLAKEEDPKKKAQVLTAWKTVPATEWFDFMSLSLLAQVLLGNDAAPLRKALIDSRLGETLADGTGILPVHEIAFAAGLKGIDPADAEKVEGIVIATLERLVKEGIDPETVDAALHQFEFAEREISNAGFPYSLRIGFRLRPTFMYGGDPYRALSFEEDFARLETERRSGPFLEDLIRRLLLDNPHRARIVLQPDIELEERERQEELARLEVIERALSDDEKQNIVRVTQRLKELQDTDTDVSPLPTLELSDIPMDFEDVAHTIEEVAGARIGLFPQPTNGISYVSIRADFSGLDDRHKDLIRLFDYIVPRMGAGGYDHLAMAARKERFTGGFGISTGLRTALTGDVRQSLTLSGKALFRNHEPFVEILRDYLADVKFDAERVKELLPEFKAGLEASIVPSGNAYAQLLAASKVNAGAALDERMRGLTQIGLVRSLASDTEASVPRLIEDLDSIRQALFRSAGLSICITSDEEKISEVRDLVVAALGHLPSQTGGAPQPLREPPGIKPEARTTASPVAFNAKVFTVPRYTDPDGPALLVLGNFIRATFLHREIREKGGAYGSLAAYDREDGLFTLSTYRDPNITRSFGVFDQAIEMVLGGGLDPREVKEAILETCRQVDPLQSPDTKGVSRFFDDLAGYSIALKVEFKKRLLEVTEEDLRRVTSSYLKDAPASIATLSSQAKVEEANAEMGGIFEVSPV